MYKTYKIAFFIVAAFFTISASATHNRAGEITFKHISGFTFEFTITTYTYSLSLANRPQLEVNWGDGTENLVSRDGDPILLPNDYQVQTYTSRHTFPGAGIYQVTMEDPNRNEGINNIPNSVNTVFSIKTTLVVNSFGGSNSTPLLLNKPLDQAARGHIFIHNPGAYDPDGDSISYELTVCTAQNGIPIDGYEFPAASDTLYINKTTGDLRWITPIDTGKYNIALYVDEWRNGTKISRILRDMQIDVYDTDNNPPVNESVSDICVRAGDTIKINFSSTDTDNDPIIMELAGGPIFDNKASFIVTESSPGESKATLTWLTTCSEAQKQSYTFVLKSQDVVLDDISLVDITSFNIRVVHNAPNNLVALPGTDTIRLEWDVSNCGFPSGYKIYRKIGESGFLPDKCETGVPAVTEYKLLSKVENRNINFYVDDNLGSGLVPGFNYCYMVTAYYSDNAESIATLEECAALIPGTPPILQVSVINNNENNGSIQLAWAKPIGIDTIDSGPYRYDVHQLAPEETEYSLIYSSIPSIDLSDTSYLVQNINTLEYPYHFSIKVLYENDDGDWIEIPGSETASSLYLSLYGMDNTIEVNMLKRAPWLNKSYTINRRPEFGSTFDSIGASSESVYLDTGLANGTQYTYQVVGFGTRPLNGNDYFTQNTSHINSASAIDTIAPCMPELRLTSICDSSYNILNWTSSINNCDEKDIVRYQIFYSPTLEGNLELIDSVNSPDTNYIHSLNLVSLAGVYGVSAVDSFDNASSIELVVIDSCQLFSLPNVFSPNGDLKNDSYLSFNQGGFVKKVDMEIFNRYGQVVFKTNNPDIDWDGKHFDSKKLVSTGVYYYICDVFEHRLTGLEVRTLKGFIHVYSGENNPQKE